jgi:hypothetical protein
MTKSWPAADISAIKILFSAIRSKHFSKKTYCFRAVILPLACRHPPGTHFAFK